MLAYCRHFFFRSRNVAFRVGDCASALPHSQHTALGACNEFMQDHLVRMGILDSAKEIADLVKKIGDIELYRKIVELEGQLIELTREKREFEERCDRFEKQLAFSKTL